MKVCSKCGRELDNSKFSKATKNKDGLRGQCRECVAKDGDEYRKRNKVEISAHHKCYYQENKHFIAEKTKQYQAVNKEKISERGRKYRENNQEALSEKKKIYRENHKDKALEYRRSHCEKNKEYSVKYGKEYRKRNKESIAIRSSIWQKEHRDSINMVANRHRARKRLLISTLTHAQWEEIKLSFSNKCCYCGKEKMLAQEHFIPVASLGSYDINNIVPACKSCNSSKGPRDFFLWYPNYEHYSKKREIFILEFLNYGKQNIQQLSISY